MRRKYLTRVALVLGLVGFISLTMLSSLAQAENFRLTIGSGHPRAAVWIESVEDYFVPEVQKRVAAKTKHTIEWNKAFGGSVSKLGEVLEGIQAGLLNVGWICIPLEPTKLGLHNFGYYTPFATADLTLATKASLDVMKKVPYMMEVFEKQYNQVCLPGATAAASYNLLTKFPVKTLDDLKGKKIAAIGANLNYIRAVPGAVPVQSNLNEGYTSLQTGVYDGWVMFVDSTVSFKLYEQAKYYIFTDFGCAFAGVITVNKDTWKSLPKEVQDIMKEVAGDWSFVEAKMAQAKAEAGVEIMKKNGVEISNFSPEQRQRWANMMPNIPLEMAKKFDAEGQPGTQVFELYQKLLEDNGYKFPRRWALK